MAEMVPFNKVVVALLDDSIPVPARYLYQFSDLEPTHLLQLKDAWPRISLTRKRNLLEDLENLAEKDTLLSFDNLAFSLLSDPDADIRSHAIGLLWECEDPKLISMFLDIINTDPSATVSAAAASALGAFIYLGELKKLPASLQKKMEDELLKTAHSSNSALVRRKAIETLGYSSRPEVTTLITTAFSSKELDWKISALIAMGRSCDQRWEKEMMVCLSHPDDDVRLEAIQACGELELEKARPVLLNLLDDETDGEIHKAILWSLSQVGGEGVRERLDEEFRLKPDPDEEGFMEEVMENLKLTDEMASFELLDLGPEE